MNSKNQPLDPNRRKFIGACCAAVGATGMLSTLAQLRMMGAVVTPDSGPTPPNTSAALPPDYRSKQLSVTKHSGTTLYNARPAPAPGL